MKRCPKCCFSLIFLIISCRGIPNSSASEKAKVRSNDTTAPQLTSSSSIASESKQEILSQLKDNPYSSNFDTTLRGNYTIVFGHTEDDQFLLLKKGNLLIDTLSSSTIGLPYKNLGYKGADFDNSFVFVHSFGSGNPHEIELYDKRTMKNLIPEGSYWIDADTTQQILLFSKTSSPTPDDNMFLFESRHKKITSFGFPVDIFKKANVVNRIRIRKATSHSIEIEYHDADIIKTKLYKY